jgi:PA domain/LVIVD repeat
MHRTMRTIVLVGSMAGLMAVPLVASAQPPPPEVSSFTYTDNMHPLGHSARVPVGGRFNSDLAFWGKTAYQGTYEGFRIIDITERDNPVEINNYAECAPGSTAGNQGDVIIWGDILVRSWNSNTGAAGSSCDGDFVPPGFEGLHVFDVSDPADPDLVASVDLPQGSHTATGVPDLDNGRLLVYNSASSGANPGIDIVEVPLDAPENAAFLRFEPSGDPTVGGGLPNLVTIAPPSTAAGTYGAAGAAFGPLPSAAGYTGEIVLVNDGVSTPPDGTPSDGCEPFTVPTGAIALLDRGACAFVVKVANAQAGGAGAVIVANNVAGAPITMGGTDPTITIPSVMVSLADGNTIKAGLPATGTVSLNELAPRSCHDTGVILGDALMAGCAGGNGFSVWSMDPADGGSLTDPQILYSRAVEGVSIGHSASFTWDGETLIFGHEPGGGGQPQCQTTPPTPEVNKTMFFFDADTGDEVGRWVLPRPQTNTENCTIHNYNIVPTAKRDVVVSGNYQSGISVVDFTDPSNAVEVAYADPAPLVPTTTGGDWSSYWYDGMIYESDITRGFTTWLLSDKTVAGAMKLGHLNPQTQEFTIG